MAAKQGKRQFGSIRKLPSGRFQVRYTGPGGHMYFARRENGQTLTFETKGDANDCRKHGACAVGGLWCCGPVDGGPGNGALVALVEVDGDAGTAAALRDQ